MLTPAEFQD